VKKLKQFHNFMPGTKLLCFLIGFFVCQVSAAFAGPWLDRITVTVRGQGPDVILIPGLTCSGAVWDATAAHLEGHYRLHVVQIDGFAGAPSRANAQGPVMQPVLGSLDAYIKTNNLKSPRIIGHSFGGTLGLALAIQHPEDVGRLMVVDALPFFGMLYGATDADSAKTMAVNLRDHTVTESQNAYAQEEKSFLPSLVKSPDGRKLATQWAIASDKSVVARATYDDLTTDLRPKLAEIKTLVTILYPWDASSPYSQSDTDGFYQRNYLALPNKKMVRVDDSLHFIMFDQPDAFLAQVDAFLK
jgi:pimeloyl-ACP methyl ester carboxylesterase